LVAVVPALTGSEPLSVLSSLGRSIAIAVAALLVITVLGIRVVPTLLFHIARVGSRELFLLSVVLLAFGTAVGSEWAGLSFALGAFLAGIVVSESEFSYQVLGGVLPLRDVFGVMFFAGLGLLADPAGLLQSWPLALTILVTVTVVKGFVAAAVVTLLGYSPAIALRSGAFLAQIGEFSFVLGLLALQVGIIDRTIYNAMIGAAIGSLLLNTLLLALTERARWLLEPPLRLLARPPALQESERPPTSQLRGHVVIAGYGRAGREVGRALQRRRFRFVVIDRDPVLVRELRSLGTEAIYGDVANEQVLLAAGIPTARVFVVAVPDAFAAETAVRLARALNPTLDIIARADRRAFVARLVEAGATEVVHPSFEAGLEMVRHTLHRFGMSMQEIQAIVSARRVDYYEEQAAIGE
jgi:CPA2 family monovalent cation:H+ antiporter-2